MSIFLWYSKGSAETGTWLADKLKIEEHGNTPPRDFDGTVVCWGATPSEKFRWEKRNFQSLFNDPRVVRSLLNRADLFSKIEEVGVKTTPFISLPVAAEGEPAISHSYSAICTSLGVTEAKGFLSCKPNGTKKTAVTTLEMLTDNIANGLECVTTTEFAQKEKVRVFVSNGLVLGAVKYSGTVPQKYLAIHLASKVSAKWPAYTEAQCLDVLSRAVDLKLFKSTDGIWLPYSLIDAKLRDAALTVASALKFDFCAVDFCSDKSGVVLNIVTTPNLREVKSVQNAITNTISSWVYRNSRTPKDILLEVIAESTCEEASSLLEELSNIKGTVKLAFKKPIKKKKANKVPSGTDSTSVKST